MVDAIFGSIAPAAGKGSDPNLAADHGQMGGSHDAAGTPVSGRPMHHLDTVVKSVRRVFDCHGAVPMSSSPLGFSSSAAQSRSAVRALLPSGSLINLRWVSSVAADDLRRRVARG